MEVVVVIGLAGAEHGGEEATGGMADRVEEAGVVGGIVLVAADVDPALADAESADVDGVGEAMLAELGAGDVAAAAAAVGIDDAQAAQLAGEDIVCRRHHLLVNPFRHRFRHALVEGRLAAERHGTRFERGDGDGIEHGAGALLDRVERDRFDAEGGKRTPAGRRLLVAFATRRRQRGQFDREVFPLPASARAVSGGRHARRDRRPRRRQAGHRRRYRRRGRTRLGDRQHRIGNVGQA